VPPGFEGVLLPRSRFVGGHPSYGRLAVCQDGYQSERVVPGCRNLQGSREGRTLGIIGFLAPAHEGLVALPRLAVLPGDGVSGCSVLQSGPVREDGEPGRSVRLASFAAASVSSMVVVASNGEATSRRTVSSLPFQHPRWDWGRWPSALSAAPMSSLA